MPATKYPGLTTGRRLISAKQLCGNLLCGGLFCSSGMLTLAAIPNFTCGGELQCFLVSLDEFVLLSPIRFLSLRYLGLAPRLVPQPAQKLTLRLTVSGVMLKVQRLHVLVHLSTNGGNDWQAFVTTTALDDETGWKQDTGLLNLIDDTMQASCSVVQGLNALATCCFKDDQKGSGYGNHACGHSRRCKPVRASYVHVKECNPRCRVSPKGYRIQLNSCFARCGVEV